MSQCVADIPVEAKMRFFFGGDKPLYEGEVIHNYGASIVLRREGSEDVVQFNAQEATSIEAMDYESRCLWVNNIAARKAEFEAMLARMRGSLAEKA